MATNNYMPMGRNPRSGGAGQAASYKKGGTTKVAGVMKKGGSPKYQYTGTVSKGKLASNTTKSGLGVAKKALEDRVKKMTPEQRALAAKAAGSAAAKRIYDLAGGDVNPTLFKIQEKLKPYAGLPTTKEEMEKAGKKASDQIMNLKKEKMGGKKYQSKGAVTAVKAGAVAAGKAASKAAASVMRPKMMKKIAKMR